VLPCCVCAHKAAAPCSTKSLCSQPLTLHALTLSCRPNIAVTAQQPPIGSNGVPKPAGIQQSLFFRTLPADRAAKRPDAEPVQRIVYPEVSDTDYGIRHIKEKPSLGLAMSGGGFRAATCAAGWTRGLHKVDGALCVPR
jgi:hypothetical protein